jgi:hypothetical protein
VTGARFRLRFTGEADQRIRLYNDYVPKAAVCCAGLYTNDGTWVAQESDGPTYRLPATGTYHLYITTDSGTYPFGLREVHGQ